MESDANPMRLVELMNNAPRCSAHSKCTGAQCKGPAMRGWTVCRMHGGGGGHKAGPTHPQWKHGLRSREWTEMRKQMNDLARIARSF